jgi:hypothetical protein
MKTVIDAVNELKGDLNNSWKYKSGIDNFIFVKSDTGMIVAYPEMERGFPDQFKYICTNKEFLATVAECETNFGKCNPINVSHYKLADKVLLEVELDMDIWSKAPEGATHCWAKMNSFYKFSKHDTDFVWHNCEWQQCADIGCFKGELTEKPQPAPTFTQEMADNGVQVEAGMKFATEAGEYIAEYTNKKSVCFTDENGFLVTITRGYAKPLTPPITLIDGECYQFDYHKGTFKGYFKLSTGRLYHSTGYYHESVCTNIQPLTVGKA